MASLQVVQVVTEVTSELVGTRVVELVVSGPQGIQGVEGPAGPGVPTGGTAGQVLVKQSATDFDLGYGLRHLGYTPASTFTYGDIATTTLTMVLDSVYYMPLLLPQSVTVSEITAQVSSAGAAGSVVRFGIYSAGVDGKPGSLVVDAGTIDGTSATKQSISTTATISGLVYLVAVAQVETCTIRAVSGFAIPNYGPVRTAAALTVREVFRQENVSGALPATANTSLGQATSGPAMRVTIA